MVTVLAMVTAGSLYAYIIGAICGVLAMRDPATQKYRENMDTLNSYMDETNLPFPLKLKLRMYFNHCQHHFRNQYYQKVLTNLSPTLMGEVSEFCYAQWIYGIPFFQPTDLSEQHRFVRTVSINLDPVAYAPREIIFNKLDPAATLHIVELGFVAVNNTVSQRGMYFGEEMLLQNGRRKYDAIALNYVDLFSL